MCSRTTTRCASVCSLALFQFFGISQCEVAKTGWHNCVAVLTKRPTLQENRLTQYTYICMYVYMHIYIYMHMYTCEFSFYRSNHLLVSLSHRFIGFSANAHTKHRTNIVIMHVVTKIYVWYSVIFNGKVYEYFQFFSQICTFFRFFIYSGRFRRTNNSINLPNASNNGQRKINPLRHAARK